MVSLKYEDYKEYIILLEHIYYNNFESDFNIKVVPITAMKLCKRNK